MMTDYFSDLAKILVGTVRKQNHENANFAEPSVRRPISKRYHQIPVEIDDHGFLFAVKFKVNSNLALSINKPDLLFSFDTRLTHSNLKNSIYSSDSELFLNQITIKDIVVIDEFISSLSLRKTEAVFMYNNSLIFGLESQRDLQLVIDKIIGWICANDHIFSVDKTKGRPILVELPDHFKPILSRFIKYSVSDDVERADMIGEMTVEERETIIEAVVPFLEEIDIYLDSFQGKPFSDGAISLGYLGELVSTL